MHLDGRALEDCVVTPSSVAEVLKRSAAQIVADAAAQLVLSVEEYR